MQACVTVEESIRRFKLSEAFLEPYKTQTPPWGPLGEFTYKRTYARKLDPEDKSSIIEDWWITCRRVIEGMFSLQKQHVLASGLAWDNAKAQRTAKEAYDRLFNLKWTPPGRGLWMMGTDYVENRTGAGLFNCGFRSTKRIAEVGAYPFSWVMDALMVGVGTGFDTKGENTIVIKRPENMEITDKGTTFRVSDSATKYVVPDDREGWVESVRLLIQAFFDGSTVHQYDYSLVRPAGELIKGFGGTSSGPEPLILLHKNITAVLCARIGKPIRSTDIVDIMNYIGKCVVAGNVRRSAELSIGRPDDEEYLALKDPTKFPEELMDRRWASNNSISARVGMSYDKHGLQSAINGEPGYIWLENARRFGRMKDGERLDDLMVMGFNPCVEQQLEDGELCCLVETFPAMHDSYEDYIRTLKIAYLYGKTVTLARTHWSDTNQIMLKNRRIGLSQSGTIQAFHRHGRRTMLEWCDSAYEYLQHLDSKYSDWLCIPKSKRMTSIKPSGTVSLLNGATPGIHFPEAEYYIRRVRVGITNPIWTKAKEAGYPVEVSVTDPKTMIVSFPIKEKYFVRGKDSVSMWEQLEIAAQYQHYWADNSVSVTVTFQPHEAAQIPEALTMYETRLKAVSFLPYFKATDNVGNLMYAQPPYQAIGKEEYEKMASKLKRMDLSEISGVGTKFCDGDVCIT